jgi:hypothetical protein
MEFHERLVGEAAPQVRSQYVVIAGMLSAKTRNVVRAVAKRLLRALAFRIAGLEVFASSLNATASSPTSSPVATSERCVNSPSASARVSRRSWRMGRDIRLAIRQRASREREHREKRECGLIPLVRNAAKADSVGRPAEAIQSVPSTGT